MCPDSRTLVMNDDGVYIFNVASGTRPINLATATSAYCFIENGKYLAVTYYEKGSGFDEGGIKIVSVADGKIIASGPKGFIPMGVLADESTVLGGMSTAVEGNRKLFAWNWRSDSSPRLFLRLPKVPQSPLQMMPDKATLTDGKHFWDLKGKLRFKIPQDADIRSQIINPSNFIALSDNKKAQIWNSQTGKVQGSVAIGSSYGDRTSFKVSPDGTMLARLILPWKGTPHVKLWDIAGGKLLRRIEVPFSTSNVYVFVFSPDGRTLAVAIAGKVLLWRIK